MNDVTLISPGVTLPFMSRALPWIVLLFVTLMASGTFAVIKYLLEFVAPVELFMLRFLPASILSIILIFIFYRKAVMQILPRVWWFFLIREAMAVFGFHLTLIYCESVLSAGATALIVAIWPVMTLFLASLMIRERLTLRKLAGGLIALAGAAVVIALGSGEEASLSNVTTSQWIRYSLILLISPLSAALVTIISRWYLARDDGSRLPDAFQFSLMCRAPAGLYAIIAYLIFSQPGSLIENATAAPPLFWILIFVLAFHNSIFGFWLWNWALQRIPAGNVASFNYVQTFFALVIAWVFLSEPIGASKVIAAIAIVCGVLLANVEFKPDKFGTGELPKVKEPISPGN